MGMSNDLSFVPVGDKILIEVTRETTKSGLILVQEGDRKPSYGIVLAVGEEVMDKSLVGRRVAFPDWVAQPIYVDSVKMYIMAYDEIFGYFRDGAREL